MEPREQDPPNGQSAERGAETPAAGRSDRAGHTPEQVWSRARDSFTDLRESVDLDGRVNRHPYGALAAALGIGYVLAGGLFTPFTGRIVGLGLRIGLRLAVLPMLKNELVGLTDELGLGRGPEDGEAGKERHETGKANAKKGRRTS